MTTLTEGARTAEFLVSEANGDRSREQITLKSGNNLPTGRVLATVITAQTIASAAKSGGNTGNGTFTLDATTPLLYGGKLGVYSPAASRPRPTTEPFASKILMASYFGDIVMSGGAATVSEQIKGVLLLMVRQTSRLEMASTSPFRRSPSRM